MTIQIPRDFIQSLLSRIDIVDFIDGRIPLNKKSSNNYFACCPFHTEKSASFSVSQTKQFYYCFGCGAHGNAIDFLIQYDRLTFPEAIETLAKHIGVEVPRESVLSNTHSNNTKKIKNAPNLYDLLNNIAVFYQTQLKQSSEAIEYLKKRQLSGEIAKQFGIGFAPSGWDHLLQKFGTTSDLKKQLNDTGMVIQKEDGHYYDRFRERIMFPIQDHRGRMVGFGGRILNNGEPKYLNSPETAIFQKGHELYGLYQALKIHRQLPRALIVEGYMDVIALFQHEVTYAMATLGTATTANHLQRLFRYASDIIFCFDGDQAGRTAAWRALLVALPLIQDGIQIRFMFLPEGEDPDTLIRKEGKLVFEKRILSALSFSQVFFQTLASQTDLSSLDGRAKLVKLATEHLNQLPKSIFRHMMLEELAKRARIDIAQLSSPASSDIKAPSLVQKARSPSALRLAISLLIQQPDLALLIKEPLPELDIRGFSLLQEILNYINLQTGLTTGALLEYFREKKDGPLIAQLACLEHMIPADGIPQEFLGAIQHIRKSGQKQDIDKLLAKANQAELSSSEKQQLHELIHNKL